MGEHRPRVAYDLLIVALVSVTESHAFPSILAITNKARSGYVTFVFLARNKTSIYSTISLFERAAIWLDDLRTCCSSLSHGAHTYIETPTNVNTVSTSMIQW